jgi:Uma2 family endonuclease
MGVEETIGFEAELQRYALTVEDFLRLDEGGAFDSIGSVELIEGEIFRLSPVHFPHADTCAEISTQLRTQLQALSLGLRAVSPVSIRLGDHNLPQPDVLVVRWPTDRDFADPSETLIAVEVSASTLRHDLVRKAVLYAAHGVPEYWVIDLKARQLHQLTDSTPEGYATREAIPFGARVVSKKVPEIALDTSAFG